MSLRNKRGLKLPKLNPETPEDHRQNLNTLTLWGNDAPLNERVVSNVRRSTNQIIPSGGWYDVDFNTVVQDIHGWFNINVSGLTLICPRGFGGLYLVHGNVYWDWAAASTEPGVGLKKLFANGSPSKRFARMWRNGAYSGVQQDICGFIDLLPGDQVRLMVKHGSGANRNILATVAGDDETDSPSLSLARISE